MSDKKWGPVQGGSMDVYKVTKNLKQSQKILLSIPGLKEFETEVRLGRYGSAMVDVLGNGYFLGDRSNGHGGKADHAWTFRIEQPPVRTRVKFSPGSVVEHNSTKFRYMLDDNGYWYSTAGVKFPPGDHSITSTIEVKDVIEGYFTIIAGDYEEVD